MRSSRMRTRRHESAGENSEDSPLKMVIRKTIAQALREIADPSTTEEGRSAARKVLKHYRIQYGVEEGKGGAV